MKQVFVLTDRKPVPVVMTGQEVSMEEQESSITYHTVWEVIIISLTNGSSPLISGWPGELLTCMNYIATEMNSESGRFVKGDSTMHSERSYKWISSISYSNKVFSARMDGYLQWISGYIYDEPKKETITVISGVYPVFQYKQTPAFFRGMDFDFHFMPINSWDYHLIASFIRANEQTTGNYLPYIPSSRFSHDLSWLHETKSHSKLRLSIRHRFVAKQTRFDSNTDLIPYTPPAYHLLGFAASFECRKIRIQTTIHDSGRQYLEQRI